MNIGDAPGHDEVRRGDPVSQLLIADLLLHLRKGSFGRAASCPGLPAAGFDLMAQFPYRYARTKDPAVCIKCRLGAFVERRWVLHLNGDAITLLQRNGRGLLQDGVNANDNRVRRFRNVREGGGPELADRGLAHLRRTTDLRILHLNHTSITDTGLSALSGNRSVENLYVGATGLTDAGLAQIGRQWKNSLQELSFADCPGVTDAGYDADASGPR